MYLRINEVACESNHVKLIETLAEDLAAMILADFHVAEVSIEIEKFILPNTQCVGVAITRGNVVTLWAASRVSSSNGHYCQR